MRVFNNSTVRLGTAAAIILGGLSLSACATNYDEEFAAINSRITAVDAKASDALQRADAAAAAAQAAGSAASNANQRIDALTTRVDTLEQQAVVSRQPRN